MPKHYECYKHYLEKSNNNGNQVVYSAGRQSLFKEKTTLLSMTYSKRNQRILETPKLNHQLIYQKPKTCGDSARQDDNTVLPFSCNQ